MKLQPTATHSPLQTQRGFSLVEVTLAVGIAAFGLAALMGLIPTGLSQFRDAKNVTVSSQIAQRLLKEAAATDYETLLGVSAGTSTPTSLVEKEVRYFDDEGIELKTSDGNPQASAIFHTYMRVLPKTLLPDSSGGALPKSNMLATVTVQVAINPSNRPISRIHRSGDPLDGMLEATPGVPFVTYTSHIAKVR